MTEEEARLSYEKYCAKENRAPMPAPKVERRGGAWLFFEVEDGALDAARGVVVRPDGEAFHFRGAIGRLFRDHLWLGNPKSNERLLGATAFGRYQAFDDDKVAIWEGPVKNRSNFNIAFPVLESTVRPHRQLSIVAFFDLRGFTTWSKASAADAAHSEEVQSAIRAFEDAVHVGFPTDEQPWEKIFVKGTGDGVMIVSQADWYHEDYEDNKLGITMTALKPGHAKHFYGACTDTLSIGREKLKAWPLAIGCAIAVGDLDRVFLFGRLDYIGPAANEAAKLQQHAWDEICVTDDFRKRLIADGRDSDSDKELPPKRWRLRSP